MFGHVGPDFSSPGALPHPGIPNDAVVVFHGHDKATKTGQVVPRIIDSVLQVTPDLGVGALVIRHRVLPAIEVNPVLLIALHDISLLSDGSIIPQQKVICKGLFKMALLLLLLSYTRTARTE